MISYYKRTVDDKRLKKLTEFKVGCWINTINPTEEELQLLQTKFKLDKQNLLSGLDKDEIPRVEFEKEATYVLLKTAPSTSQEGLDTILIVVADDFILTLTKKELSSLKYVEENKRKIVTTQRKRSLIDLFILINKDFEKTTREIVKEVNADKKQFKQLTEKDINDLLFFETKLNSLVSAYSHANLIYNKILKRIKFFERDKDIIEDLMIEAGQGLNLCKNSLKTITNIRNSVAIVLSNRLNKTITLLTILTVLIGISTAISGLYGMNVSLPFQHTAGVFYYLLALVAVIWIAFLILFKKKNLL